ncbi:unnamed protein product [Mytilus coruscus]|uniref:Mutator-like transposase domain-containing protein n=1 Tax=Mytilus coruscus TaxID=42192 RepID=A0A6J8D8D9_MYTCO|nr:unnamed protein product [Mytilus coruscus]
MESQAGMQAVKELLEQGTPVKTIEGDGDNTLIARLKSELNLTVTKKFDKTHTIKNIVSRLYELQKNNKNLKISSLVIRHLTKSIKYVFAKNQGQPDDMKKNLEALIPHQFGDHNLCQPRFCRYKRQPGVKYLHTSLPYKAPLTDPVLREKLQNLLSQSFRRQLVIQIKGLTRHVRMHIEPLPCVLQHICTMERVKAWIFESKPLLPVLMKEETTCLRRNNIPHIVQIAATEHKTQTIFNRYIQPQLPMSNEAEKVTGIVWDGQKLFYKGVELNFVNIKDVISDFFMWLNQCSNSVLVAHNGKSFDFRVLSTAVYNCNMFDNFTQILMGLVDSLAVLDQAFQK